MFKNMLKSLMMLCFAIWGLGFIFILFFLLIGCATPRFQRDEPKVYKIAPVQEINNNKVLVLPKNTIQELIKLNDKELKKIQRIFGSAGQLQSMGVWYIYVAPDVTKTERVSQTAETSTEVSPKVEGLPLK